MHLARRLSAPLSRIGARIAAPIQALKARQKRAAALTSWMFDKSPEKALQYMRQSVDLITRARPNSSNALIFVMDASVCAHHIGDLDAAADYLKQGVEMLPHLPDTPVLTKAQLYQRQGRVREDRQQLREAEESYIFGLRELSFYPVPFAAPLQSDLEMEKFLNTYGFQVQSPPTADSAKSHSKLFQYTDELSSLRHQLVGDLAMVLEKQERWDDADPLHRHIILAQADPLRQDFPHISSSLHDLLQPAHMELGSLTLEWQVKRLGQDNPALTNTLFAQAYGLMALKRFDESNKILMRLMNVQRIYRGPESPAAAAVHSAIGKLRALEERWEEANEHFTRAYEIRKAAYSQYHIHSALALYDSGVAKHKLQKFAAAHENYEEALHCLRPQLGQAHGYIRRMQEQFGTFTDELTKVFATTSKLPPHEGSLLLHETLMGGRSVFETLRQKDVLMQAAAAAEEAKTKEKIIKKA